MDGGAASPGGQRSDAAPAMPGGAPWGAASGRCRSKMRSSFSAPPVHMRQALSPRAKDTLRTMCLCCRAVGRVVAGRQQWQCHASYWVNGRQGGRGTTSAACNSLSQRRLEGKHFWHSGIASSIGLMTKRLNQRDDRQEWTEGSGSVTDRLAGAGGNCRGVWHAAMPPAHCAHLELMQLVAGGGIPHACREVSRGCGSNHSRVVEDTRPHGSLVPLERADPVASGRIAQHGLAILGCRCQEHAVRGDGAAQHGQNEG